MNKIIAVLICVMLTPSLLTAESLEEKRRIEEGKRESLKVTETAASAKPKRRPPLEPVDIAYIAELSLRQVTYGYDACKAMTMLLGVENEYIDLNAQVDFIKKNRFLPKNFESEFDPMKPLRKGLAAYMFCKALDIKGGVIIRLSGLNPRYALKELVFEGIMPPGNTNDILRGEELVAAITQAINYIDAQKIHEKE